MINFKNLRKTSGRRKGDLKYAKHLIVIALITGILIGMSATLAWSVEIYWSLPPGSYSNHECVIPVEGDVLPLDKLRNCLLLYADAEKEVVIACMEDVNLKFITNEVIVLSKSTSAIMRIGKYYIGKSIKDVWEWYPELKNAVILIDNGDKTFSERPVLVDKHFQGCE